MNAQRIVVPEGYTFAQKPHESENIEPALLKYRSQSYFDRLSHYELDLLKEVHYAMKTKYQPGLLYRLGVRSLFDLRFRYNGQFLTTLVVELSNMTSLNSHSVLDCIFIVIDRLVALNPRRSFTVLHQFTNAIFNLQMEFICFYMKSTRIELDKIPHVRCNEYEMTVKRDRIVDFQDKCLRLSFFSRFNRPLRRFSYLITLEFFSVSEKIEKIQRMCYAIHRFLQSLHDTVQGLSYEFKFTGIDIVHENHLRMLATIAGFLNCFTDPKNQLELQINLKPENDQFEPILKTIIRRIVYNLNPNATRIRINGQEMPELVQMMVEDTTVVLNWKLQAVLWAAKFAVQSDHCKK